MPEPSYRHGPANALAPGQTPAVRYEHEPSHDKACRWDADFLHKPFAIFEGKRWLP